MVQTHEPAEFDRPLLAHAQVGQYLDPVSRIESFKNVMDSGVGDKADMAFFKFCYVAGSEERIPVMALEYADDGGHLNSQGRKKVAEQLLILLGGIATEL